MPNGATPVSNREREGAYAERIEKEVGAWMDGDKRRDPFAPTLAALVGGGPEAAAPTGAAARSSQLSGSQASRASRRSSAMNAPVGSQLSIRRGGSQLGGSQLGGSQLGGSQMAGMSALSWRTPSSIRSNEPSEIARNKIAELQLRVELERVVRLQREMELEQKRKDGLIKETSSILGGK